MKSEWHGFASASSANGSGSWLSSYCTLLQARSVVVQRRVQSTNLTRRMCVVAGDSPPASARPAAPQSDCVARCGYTVYPFGYEYLGNTQRLVVTPLTERAFSSMMAAVHLHYGGAPEGPAGACMQSPGLRAAGVCVHTRVRAHGPSRHRCARHCTSVQKAANQSKWHCLIEPHR